MKKVIMKDLVLISMGIVLDQAVEEIKVFCEKHGLIA